MNTQNNRQWTLGGARKLALVLLIALAAASCSTSTATDSVVVAEPTTAEPSSTSTTETNATETDAIEPPAAEEPTAEEVGVAAASWQGPSVAPLLDARMDELSAPFGSPFSPDAVADIFATPTDFLYPEGTITGILHDYDLDERVTDEIDIEEERIIGLAGDPSDTVLDAIADDLEADPTSRWARSSAQRQDGQAWNDLFTAEDGNGDGAKDRLVLTSDIAPDPDESDVKISVDFNPTEIPEPAWAEGLPVAEGGRLVAVFEGIGLVKDFQRPGGNGTIRARWSYPVEAVPDLVAFLNSGVVGAAGFEHEDLTVTDDPSGRFDVSIGDWEGQLLVSTFSIRDTDPAGYHILWALDRA